jgi:azurin
MIRKIASGFLLVTSFLLMISCGSQQETEKTSNKEKEINSQSIEDVTTSTEVSNKEVVEIVISALGDNMSEIRYDLTEIEVVEGTRIKISLVNESKTKGMPHNMVLVEFGKGKEVADAGVRAGQDNGFVPKDHPSVIAYSPLVDIEETVTFEFDAPKVGSYHYVCTYPGHFPKMFGTLNVIEY